MKTYGDALDPKSLIHESYRIDGITAEECRSIFLDWALSMGDGDVAQAALPQLITRYAAFADHPMTAVLRDGLDRFGAPRRRGGWRSRPR